MDDVPWLYVAMIFIAFASWVWNRIQEAAAARRERIAERKKVEHSRRTTQAPERDSPQGRQHSSGPPKSFRDVFKELEAQLSEPEQAEPAATSPTPAPPPLPEPPVEELSNFDAAKIIESSNILEPSSPLQVKKSRNRRNRETSEDLVKTLRNQGSLRTTLILKEVLDRPKALRRKTG